MSALKGGFKTITSNKSLFLGSFIFVFIISLVNSYFENNMTVGDLNSIGDTEVMGSKEVIQMLFNLFPIFLIPSLFALIAREKTASKFKILNIVLTPIKRFRYLIVFMFNLTAFPILIGLSLISFSGVISTSIDYNKYIIYNSETIEKYIDSDTQDINDPEFKYYIEVIDNSEKLAVARDAEIEKITPFDIGLGITLLTIVIGFYINLYVTASAFITTTNAGFFKSLRISTISFFKNFKFVILYLSAWILFKYFTNVILAYTLGSSQLLDITVVILDSIASVTIIFMFSYVIFKRLFNENDIITIKPYIEDEKKEYFSKNVMLDYDVNFESFNFISYDNKDQDVKEDEVIKNKLMS